MLVDTNTDGRRPSEVLSQDPRHESLQDDHLAQTELVDVMETTYSSSFRDRPITFCRGPREEQLDTFLVSGDVVLDPDSLKSVPPVVELDSGVADHRPLVARVALVTGRSKLPTRRRVPQYDRWAAANPTPEQLATWSHAISQPPFIPATVDTASRQHILGTWLADTAAAIWPQKKSEAAVPLDVDCAHV